MNFNNSVIDWKQVDNVISSSNRILLTTHENPDGDGLGSEVAMYHHLCDEKKDVKIINCSITPSMFDYINEDGCIETYDENYHLEWLKKCDLVVVFDVGDFNRTRDIKKVVERLKIPVMNIDHHPHPEKHPFTHNLVDLSAAATGCMVYDYLKVVRENAISKDLSLIHI